MKTFPFSDWFREEQCLTLFLLFLNVSEVPAPPPPLFKILRTLLFSKPKIETYRWSKNLNFGYKPPLYSNSIQSLGCSPSYTLCAVGERKLVTLFSSPFEHNSAIAALHMHGWGFALSFALMQVKQGICECQFCRLWFDLTGNWIRINRFSCRRSITDRLKKFTDDLG